MKKAISILLLIMMITGCVSIPPDEHWEAFEKMDTAEGELYSPYLVDMPLYFMILELVLVFITGAWTTAIIFS